MRRTILMGMMMGILLLCGCESDGESFARQAYTPDGAVREIQIDARDRKIEVKPSEDDQVHLVYYESDKEFYEISNAGNKLVMTAQNDKTWQDYFGSKAAGAGSRTIELRVPAAGMASVDLKTTNEDIVLTSLAVTGEVTAFANHGSVSFSALEAGQGVSLEAKNGGVSGTLTGRYEDYAIESHVKKGKSNLPEQKADGEKTLSVRTNNGDIEVAFQGAA